MRKRGDLTNNVLSLIVAVIGIGLIAYGIVKLYNVYSSDENKNALKTLENIKSKIDNLGDGQKADILIQGFKGGNNRYIVGYSKEGYERKPDKCYFESCICVCRGTSKESCQSGYCEEVEQEKVNVYTDLHYSVFIVPGDNYESRSEKLPYIQLEEKLFKLSIEKNNEMIKISASREGKQRYEGPPSAGGV